MKRIIRTLLLFMILFGVWTVFCSAEKVVLSKQKLSVDGKAVKCEVYNIDGSNYFKLRDLAQLLDGTAAQFSITWDEKLQTITIQSAKPYEPVGGELEIGSDKSATAKRSGQSILINGKTADNLTAYNIGGNNFFRLGQLAGWLYFNVDYNEAADMVSIVSVQRTGCETC
ncbi:MAG: hypothetical protein Q3977_02930 [Oscillospiraceae bacterium]|nr:hypothetical protein [Oscillospiraceae bacterium]